MELCAQLLSDKFRILRIGCQNTSWDLNCLVWKQINTGKIMMIATIASSCCNTQALMQTKLKQATVKWLFGTQNERVKNPKESSAWSAIKQASKMRRSHNTVVIKCDRIVSYEHQAWWGNLSIILMLNGHICLRLVVYNISFSKPVVAFITWS